MLQCQKDLYVRSIENNRMRSFIIVVSPFIIRVMKSRRMEWVRNTEHMGNMRNAFKILAG